MRILYILLFLLSTQFLQAQKHGYIWLMGQNSQSEVEHAGMVIDFNVSPPDIYNDFRDMYLRQTNASISDTAGNLLFYTNGIYIANALNEVMENGEGLNPGVAANAWENFGYILPQGAMILPVPEQDSLYHLLHMDRILPTEAGIPHSSEHLYYTLINVNENQGLGRVIEKNQVILEGIYTHGKLTATRHANGRDWWILIRKYDTNRYTRILLNENGFLIKNQQVGQPIPSNSIGQAVFSPDGSKYANLHLTGAAGDPIHVSIYDFDRCTGLLSEPIQFTYADSAWAGGIAISPNSRFLYVSSYHFLYQYDLWAENIEASKDTIAVWDGFQEDGFFSTTFYLAQLAPDGKIYINSNNGVSYLHVINNPNLPGDSCNVCQHCVDLPSVNSFSMPNFPNYRLKHLEDSPCDTLRQPPTAAFDYEMIGNEVFFTDTSFHDIRSWYWDFGDGQVDSVARPVHGYAESGAYEVCLEVENPRGRDTLCRVIEVVVTGVDDMNTSNLKSTLFPNPTDARFLLSWDHKLPDRSQIVVSNLLGQVQNTETVPLGEVQQWVDISHLPNGVYWVQLTAQGEILGSRKVIKQ